MIGSSALNDDRKAGDMEVIWLRALAIARKCSIWSLFDLNALPCWLRP